MSAVAPSLPTGLMPRFALFIADVKLTMGEVILRRHEAVPLAMLLWDYLSATQRRLTALHARFAAGKLPAAPRAPRPATERTTTDRPRTGRRPPGIPTGPVLLTVFRARFDEMLQALLDDPEMRALLAASPRAGRILRPLWRKLTIHPLPAVLRLPPKPRLPRNPEPPRVVRPRNSRTAPAARPEPPSPAPAPWEPTACVPPWPD